jgi:regulator of RNase E activity RraA
LGETITIGNVVINTGDWVVADRDGIVIIPGDLIHDVVDEAELVMNTESKVRAAIRDGLDPKDAYLKFGKF